MPNHYIFTLMMATSIFAVIVDNFQHLTLLILKDLSCTLNTRHGNLRTKMTFLRISQITFHIKYRISNILNNYYGSLKNRSTKTYPPTLKSCSSSNGIVQLHVASLFWLITSLHRTSF